MAPVMESFYVLRPTPALLAWLKERGVPARMGLDRPHLWSQREVGDHDFAGHAEDEQTFLKLAVLARFLGRMERASKPSESEFETMPAPVLAELLGPPPLTVETFDRWWSLERADAPSSVEFTLAHTPLRTLRKVQGPRVPGASARGHRPVGEWWDNAIREREEDVPRLQCAVAWVLAWLEEKTPHRVCALRIRPFSLEAPLAEVLHVPGWTLRGTGHDLLEGIKLILEDFTWGDDTWTFTYKVYSGERRATSSGALHLVLEKRPDGWAVSNGTDQS